MPPFHIGVAELFQSTLPLRGATLAIRDIDCVTGNFNPHSPCGERRTYVQFMQFPIGISIHTPLAGSDSAKNGVTFGNV